MEIEFPIEFIVHGTPVSLQTKRPESRAEWRTLVRDAARPALPAPHFASDHPIAVTLLYLPASAMQGDIDNIVKPVLDALSRFLYLDDHQVERVVVQKFEPGNPFPFEDPSPIFALALGGPRPVLFVRVSDDPFEELS
jgi:crossover junction endodeoxyribonuclease RusA